MKIVNFFPTPAFALINTMKQIVTWGKQAPLNPATKAAFWLEVNIILDAYKRLGHIDTDANYRHIPAKNLGVNVKIHWTMPDGKHYHHTYYNVTEIHYKPRGEDRIAFESNIHCTGTFMPIEYLTEYETEPATVKATGFDTE